MDKPIFENCDHQLNGYCGDCVKKIYQQLTGPLDPYIDVKINIQYSPAGEISPNGCWTAVESSWLYIADNLQELLIILLTQWRHDRHLGA